METQEEETLDCSGQDGQIYFFSHELFFHFLVTTTDILTEINSVVYISVSYFTADYRPLSVLTSSKAGEQISWLCLSWVQGLMTSSGVLKVTTQFNHYI